MNDDLYQSILKEKLIDDYFLFDKTPSEDTINLSYNYMKTDEESISNDNESQNEYRFLQNSNDETKFFPQNKINYNKNNKINKNLSKIENDYAVKLNHENEIYKGDNNSSTKINTCNQCDFYGEFNFFCLKFGEKKIIQI